VTCSENELGVRREGLEGESANKGERRSECGGGRKRESGGREGR